ncbi:hypothetical protein LIER_25024 [Lithospermum erythrorhizon]|uniref:Uncharacterized protein n=1 Tax=Lithospermum erythrorhizon TaxID=34254 RepID=A0AAV3R4N8_LITER
MIRSKEFDSSVESPVTWDADGTTTALRKRPSNFAASSRPVFAKRTKVFAHNPPRPEVVDITNETFQSEIPSDPVVGNMPIADNHPVDATPSKGKGD